MAVEEMAQTSMKSAPNGFSKMKVYVWVGLLLLSAVVLAFVSPKPDTIFDKIILALALIAVGLGVLGFVTLILGKRSDENGQVGFLSSPANDNQIEAEGRPGPENGEETGSHENLVTLLPWHTRMR